MAAEARSWETQVIERHRAPEFARSMDLSRESQLLPLIRVERTRRRRMP